jgi:protease II
MKTKRKTSCRLSKGLGYPQQEEIDHYLKRWRAYTEAAWQEQQRNPPEFVRELRERIQRRREVLLAERGPEYLVTGR